LGPQEDIHHNHQVEEDLEIHEEDLWVGPEGHQDPLGHQGHQDEMKPKRTKDSE
jgi:hypothetical protein